MKQLCISHDSVSLWWQHFEKLRQNCCKCAKLAQLHLMQTVVPWPFVLVVCTKTSELHLWHTANAHDITSGWNPVETGPSPSTSRLHDAWSPTGGTFRNSKSDAKHAKHATWAGCVTKRGTWAGCVKTPAVKGTLGAPQESNTFELGAESVPSRHGSRDRSQSFSYKVATSVIQNAALSHWRLVPLRNSENRFETNINARFSVIFWDIGRKQDMTWPGNDGTFDDAVYSLNLLNTKHYPISKPIEPLPARISRLWLRYTLNSKSHCTLAALAF